MRRAWLVAVIVAVLLVPVPVGSQAESNQILDDRNGDVNTEVAGTPAPDSGRNSHLDLRSLAMTEDAEYLYVILGVDEIEPEPAPSIVERGVIYAHFSIGGEDYRVEFFGGTFGRLMNYDATLERWAQIRNIEVSPDNDEDTYTAPLPRRDMQDASGAPLYPDVPVTNFYATSQGLFGPGCEINFGLAQQPCPISIYDRMPDNGEPTGTYTPIFGVAQSGHLRLRSDTPVRASNGDDTTYVFEVILRNGASVPDDVLLSVQGAPDSWDVRIPAADVRMDANGTVKLPVLVSTPFAHMHGEFQSLLVEAHSQRDPNAVGRVELGIRYTEIPQPAGHHNTVWLHSRDNTPNNEFGTINRAFGGGQQAYFNAAQEDDNSEEIDISAFSCGGDGAIAPLVSERTVFCWFIYLEPTLEMGLDFDVNGTGTMNFPIETTVPLQDAYMEGELRYLKRNPAANNNFNNFNDGRIQTLGTFAPTDRGDVAVNGAEEFDLEFTPSPDADLIPFAPEGASVWLQMYLNVGRPPTFVGEFAAAPVLVPGGSFQMPLFEYEDPVDDLFHSLTDVDIEMDTPQEAYVNPGETILFEMRIVNSGVVNDRFALSIDGTNAEWAEILGDRVIDVRAGTSRHIAVAVAPPLIAEDGEQADLIFQATSTKDPDARALVRLLAEVDTEIDYADQALLVDSTDAELTTKKVPSPLGLFVLAGAALLARRR